MVVENPLRDAGATLECPICKQHFAASGHKRYCTDACRRTAWRRRHQTVVPPQIVIPANRARRPLTVYQCDECETRSVGSQRCEQCGSFMRRVGFGGPCPHCDAPVAIEDLLDEEVMPAT
jgi:hypothetical protein